MAKTNFQYEKRQKELEKKKKKEEKLKRKAEKGHAGEGEAENDGAEGVDGEEAADTPAAGEGTVPGPSAS